MKKDLVLLSIVAAILAVALVSLSWSLGQQNGRLSYAQDSTSEDVAKIADRLLPIEQDLHRRKELRGFFSRSLAWISKKLGW